MQKSHDRPSASGRRAFAGMGWHVPALLDRLSRAGEVYLDEVAQVVVPRWSAGRVALLGDAASAVSLIAGEGSTLALAGAVVLADALADRPGAMDGALAAYEARLRPWAEAAQRMARGNGPAPGLARRPSALTRRRRARRGP